jgi:hypothetical protein
MLLFVSCPENGGRIFLRIMGILLGDKISRDGEISVATVLAMNNRVFWDVTPCGSCKNRRFGGT